MTSNATVTIPFNEFQEITNARDTALTRAAEAEAKLREGKIAANDGTTYAVARAALDVVRLAIGNLPPETTRGWPIAALRVLAEQLPVMDGASTDDRDFATTIGYFADECAKCELQRKAQAKSASLGELHVDPHVDPPRE